MDKDKGNFIYKPKTTFTFLFELIEKSKRDKGVRLPCPYVLLF